MAIGTSVLTQFIGANRNELGVQKFTLGLLGVVGSGVSGWNPLPNYDYWRQ